jgi:hypothetical protein
MADFGFHKMNADGQRKSQEIADLFETLLRKLKAEYFFDARTAAICNTKLEEACFYAKKSMALNTDNQADV